MVEVDLLRLMRFLLLSLCLFPILASYWDYPLTKNFLVWVGGGVKMDQMLRMSKRDSEQGPKEDYWVRMSKRDDEQGPKEIYIIRTKTEEEERRSKEDYMMKISKRDVFEWRPTENYMNQMPMVARFDRSSLLPKEAKAKVKAKGSQRKLMSRIGK